MNMYYALVLVVFVFYQPIASQVPSIESLKPRAYDNITSTGTTDVAAQPNPGIGEMIRALIDIIAAFPRVDKDQVANLITLTEGARNFINKTLGVVAGVAGPLAPIVTAIFRVVASDWLFFVVQYGLYTVWRLLPTSGNEKWQVVIKDKRVVVSPKGTPTLGMMYPYVYPLPQLNPQPKTAI